MKLVYIECNEAEMKANRTFIDALTDIAKSIVDTLNSPVEEDFDAVDENKQDGEVEIDRSMM